MTGTCKRCRIFINNPDCNNCLHKPEKEKGLYGKFFVQKINNPDKKIDCIVLEFDDPIARIGIEAWGKECIIKGYKKLGHEVLEKLKLFNQPDGGSND